MVNTKLLLILNRVWQSDATPHYRIETSFAIWEHIVSLNFAFSKRTPPEFAVPSPHLGDGLTRDFPNLFVPKISTRPLSSLSSTRRLLKRLDAYLFVLRRYILVVGVVLHGLQVGIVLFYLIFQWWCAWPNDSIQGWDNIATNVPLCRNARDVRHIEFARFINKNNVAEGHIFL